MSASIIEFRPRDGLTQDECNTAMARLRPVMETLCGAQGRRAVITTRRNEDGTLCVSAELDDGGYALRRHGGRYMLYRDWDIVAEAGSLDDVLAVATQPASRPPSS